MKAIWQIEEAGWLNLELNINKKIHTYHYGWTTDFIGDFLETLVSLTNLYDDYFDKKICFWAFSEPVIDLWELKKIKDKPQIRITSCKDVDIQKIVVEKNLLQNYNSDIFLPKEKIIEIVEIEVNYREFLQEIVKSLDELLNKYGIIGYRINIISFEFPLSLYLILKIYCLDNNILKITMLPLGENQYIDAKLSELAEELRIIKLNN